MHKFGGEWIMENLRNTPHDAELIAVLTAAIAASLNTSAYNLRIKSFRRVDGVTPAWSGAGRMDIMNSRL